MKVVLDTNVLLVSISDRPKHHWLYKALIQQKFDLCVTNEILTEYDEKISEHWHPDVAKSVLRTLMELPNVELTTVYFNLLLIVKDPDDDKFVDCSFAANSDYLVSNDKDFNILRHIDFPSIKVVKLEAFKEILERKTDS